MPRRNSPEVRRQVIELARAETRVLQLAAPFHISDATVYSWLMQDRTTVSRPRAAAPISSSIRPISTNAKRGISQLEPNWRSRARLTRCFGDREAGVSKRRVDPRDRRVLSR